MGRSQDPRVITLMAVMADNLRRFREHRGWSQAELARRSGFTADAIAKWERGDKWPDPGAVKLLSQSLGMLMDDLFASPLGAQAPPQRPSGRQPSR